MNILERIRANNKLSNSDAIGVRGTFGKEMAIEGDNRTVMVIANTNDVDLQQEVVVPSGADLSYFKSNGSVFCDHRTDVQNFVGIRRNQYPYPSAADHSAWMVRVFVRETPLGNDILSMVRAGGLGVSIGFIPTDWGRPTEAESKSYGPAMTSIVRAWKWLELSFTAFPCNVACRSMEIPAGDTRKAGILDNLLCKGAIRRESAAAVGFPVKIGRKISCRVT